MLGLFLGAGSIFGLIEMWRNYKHTGCPLMDKWRVRRLKQQVMEEIEEEMGREAERNGADSERKESNQ